MQFFALSSRDWPEDFGLENGNYLCRCHACQQTFVGYKRRVTCKECHIAAEKKFQALRPEEQKAMIEKTRAEVDAWVSAHQGGQA